MGISPERKRFFAQQRYEKLLLEITKLEQELYPNLFSYHLFNLEGNSYIRFPAKMNYPIKIVEMIIKDSKKHTVEKGFTSMGLILEMPENLKKLLGKNKSGTISIKAKKVAKKPLKTPKKANKKKVTKKKVAVKKKTVLKRDNNGRFKSHK